MLLNFYLTGNWSYTIIIKFHVTVIYFITPNHNSTNNRKFQKIMLNLTFFNKNPSN